MMVLPTSPALLMVGVLALVAGGLITMTWGRRLPRQGDWIVSLGILALLIVAGLGWSTLTEQSFAPSEWARGWIWPRDEAGAITVGILRDALGLAMATLTAIVAGSVMLGGGGAGPERRADRFNAALALSAGGVALSWFALTPWLAMTGAAIVVFGGFLALGSRWDVPREAMIATRFGWEHTWGLIFALLGLCVLAGGRAPLSLIHPTGAGAWAAQSESGLSDLLGAGLLFLGAVVQLQPFPLLGWVMSESETHCPARVVLAQVFPAWAIFALLLRLEPQFREVGVFPNFGWVGLVSSMLAALAGVFRPQWRLGLGAWVSAGFSLAVAALAFAGPTPAFCLLVGVGLGASALAGFAAALEEGGAASSTGRQRALWSKAGCGFAAAAGTGFIGFVAAGGGVRWLTFVWGQPALAAMSVLVFFLFAFLGWKVAWQAISLKNTTQASWASVLSPFILVLLALGAVWTGTATGGVLPGYPDRLFHSFLSLLFGAPGEAWGDESGIATASALYWGSLVVAMGAAFWTAGKKQEFWPAVFRSMPRLSSFIASGYGVDVLFARVAELLAAVGRWSVWLLDRKAWDAWIPAVLGKGLRRGAAAVATADRRLSWGIGGMLRQWVEAPSKLLQLIQNGDVQWYLFFAVGSGIAILAHFMRA